MALVLRKIRKSKWYKSPSVPWLSATDLQADALSDLGTKANALSVYFVREDLSDLDRVVAAVAACGDHVSIFDYTLFDEALLHQSSFKLSNTPGTTPDTVVNNQNHRDLIELSRDAIVELSKTVQKAQTHRIHDKKVADLIRDSIKNGCMKADDINPELRSSLLKYVL